MKSIQMRLMIGLLASSVLVLSVGAVVIHFATRALLLREFDSTLRAKSMALAAASDVKTNEVEFDLADELLQEFSRPRSAEYFQLWDSSGKSLARSRSLGTNDLPHSFTATPAPQFWNLNMPDGRHGRAVGFSFTPEISGSDEHPPAAKMSNPPVTLVVASSLHGVRRTLETLTNALLLAAAIVLAGMLILVRLIVRRGLAPLAGVADQAARIDASSLGLRFETESLPTELLPIARRLNDLLARLGQSFERERQFTADAAHELRTPIAELRSLAEVALKWPEGAETTTQSFRDALEIARRMEAIATGLLSLARCEAGKEMIRPELVVVEELARETWHSLADQAGRRQLQVIFDVPPDIRFRTDRSLFGLILSNLVSNAVEYAPAGGAIRISAEQRADQFRLSVANTVDNLGPDDLPHLFERFWRKDPARTSSEHSGLGLSLAKAFAELLGMKVRADLVRPGTLVISLEAPIVG